MTRYAAKTEVPVERSRAEIETILRRYGADSFISGWDGDKVMVRFRASGRHVRFLMTMPDRADPRFTHFDRGGAKVPRTANATAEMWEQPCRQKWRALVLLVKAKLEAVESGIVTFEEEFFGHVMLPDGASVYEHAKAAVETSYVTGQFRPLLGGPEERS